MPLLSRRRVRTGLLFSLLLAAVAAVICWIETPFRVFNALVLSSPDYGFPSLSPDEEFREVATRLVQTSHQFHGQRQLDELRARLERVGDDRTERCELLTAIAADLIRLGETGEGVKTIDEALAIAEEPNQRHLLPFVHRQRMTVYLRLAEEQNCVAQHCQHSCIYPIQRGGIHQRRHAAEEARRSLRAYLATNPPQAEGLPWLENVLAMILGEYPNSVPPDELLPVFQPPESAGFPRFVDVAREAGLARLSVAGGVACGDVNQDGLLDLVSTSSGPFEPLMLFHGRDDGKFVDRAQEAGVHGQLGGLHCELVDYDNDGLLDIFVPRGGWFRLEGRIRNSLLRNQGDGTFRDVTREAGLAYPAYPTQTAVWGDFDNDGDLDLFIGNEAPTEFYGLGRGDFPSQYFVNNGDGTFTDQTRSAGLYLVRWVKGAAAGDYDNDGDLDLYVSSHSLWDHRRYGENFLFRNDGDGTFTDVAAEMGVTRPWQSFACWFFDYNHDGWLDLLVVPYGQDIDGDDHTKFAVRDARGQPHGGEAPRLYRNERGAGFTDVTVECGLDHPYLAMGSCFGDLDNDGYLDVYLGTGGPEYETLVPNIMLRNDAGRRFIDVTVAGGFGHLQKGHGVSFADLDNDGDQDVYADMGGFYTGDKFTTALFANPGNKNRFLKISLVGQSTNRFGVGARVSVRVDGPDGERTFHHAMGCVPRFGSVPDRLEVGLGRAERIAGIDVWWPTSGERQSFGQAPLDSWIRIREGQADFEQVPLKRLDFDRHMRAALETVDGDES